MSTEGRAAPPENETETETEVALDPARNDADPDVPLTLLELVLAEHAARTEPAAPAPPPSRIEGVVIGTVVALGPAGEPLVDYPGSPDTSLPARAMTAIGAVDIGRSAALLFEGGDPGKPVVMGLMHASTAPQDSDKSAPAVAPTGEVDGERLVFNAEKEIVLRCGNSSITLTRAGKILIRGAYVLTRSSGVNRIQGGSVQIN